VGYLSDGAGHLAMGRGASGWHVDLFVPLDERGGAAEVGDLAENRVECVEGVSWHGFPVFYGFGRPGTVQWRLWCDVASATDRYFAAQGLAMKLSRVLIVVAIVAMTGLGIWVSLRFANRVEQDAAMALPDGFTLRFFKDPKMVPDFTVTTLDGRTITADSLRGKVVVINFWATWCGPCRVEVPDLVALQEKYRDEVVVLGLSTDEGSPDAVRQFVEQFEINYPVAIVSRDVEQAFEGITGLPTSFIVDPEGRVVQKHVGLLNAVLTEQETRSLAGMDVNARIEYVDADRPIGLDNLALVREIPGVDLVVLTSDQRVEVLQTLNEEGCGCGCGLTVARCRVDDPSCDVSLPRARMIVDQIAAR